MQVKKQQLESDTEQRTGSKSVNEYVQDVCCHPAYLIYMQSTSCEISDWMKDKLKNSSNFDELIKVFSEIEARYEGCNIVVPEYYNLSFVDLCNKGIDLLTQIRDE